MMSWLIRGPKNAAWWGLSRLLSLGTRLVRCVPGPTVADEWRATSFSFSQFGEDLIVLSLLRDLTSKAKKGIYVDVGAFHPAFFSNTLLLHKYGWTGINIEANQERVKLFKRYRPSDLSIQAVVSDSVRIVRYANYPSEAFNGVFESSTTPEANTLGELPTRVDEVSTCTLTELLDRYLPAGATIDFLNVDCEGQDFQVLTGLDWSRWQPRLVSAEGKSGPERERLVEFMKGRGYEVAASLLITIIFAQGEKKPCS